MTKSAKTKPVAEIRPVVEEKLTTPAAISIISSPETEKNKNAGGGEHILKKSSLIKQGFKKIVDEKFKLIKRVTFPLTMETSLQKKGYDLREIRTRTIPYYMDLDYENLPEAAFFQKGNNQYYICSESGFISFRGPYFDSMGKAFFFELVIKNESDRNDCLIELGITNNGLLKKGVSIVKKEILPPGSEKTIQWETSAFDPYSRISPIILLKGTASFKSFEVYQLFNKDFTVVEGTIVDRSSLPKPETTDYPDCRFTAHFTGNSIVRGAACNRELSLSIDGFVNKKILPTNTLKKGDKIKCAIVRFDSVPAKFSEIQEADNLSLFSLDSYLVTTYEKLPSFSDYSSDDQNIGFKDSTNGKNEYISIFKRQINPDMPEELKKSQREAIQEDLTRINALLQPYSQERKTEINALFHKVWDEEKSKDPPEYNRIKNTAHGNVVWRNVDNSFYALPEEFDIIKDYPAITQRNLDAIIAFRDYLDSQGIQLIISLVPDFYDISSRVINKKFSDLPDFRTANVVKTLLENNIEALYPSDTIISKYNHCENPFFYPANPHPGDLPQDVLSDILADRLSRYHFPRQMAKKGFQIVKQRFPSNLFLFPDHCDIGSHQAGDYYSYRKVEYCNGPVPSDPKSPVLVLGNSYSYTPEGIFKYLSMKLGIGIYQYNINGEGILSTAIQRIYNNPQVFLSNRKVIILSIGTIHLTSNCTFPNIRDLDRDALLLKNLRLSGTIKVFSNEISIPSFAQGLSDPSVFKTNKNGECSIIMESNVPTSGSNESKDRFIVIYYCCNILDNFKIIVNGASHPLSGSFTQYVWSRIVIPLQQGDKKISVKVIGKPNAFIAFKDIQIWQ